MWKYVERSHWIMDTEIGAVICSNVLNAAAGEKIAKVPAMLSLIENVASCGKGDGPVSLQWMHKVIDEARAILTGTNQTS